VARGTSISKTDSITAVSLGIRDSDKMYNNINSYYALIAQQDSWTDVNNTLQITGAVITVTELL